MYKPPEGTYLSLPSQPTFYTWLTIDGVAQPLYSLQVSEDKTVCYVESRIGGHFAVHFGSDEQKKRKKGFQATVLIDGKWQRGKNITSEAIPGLWSLAARRDSESTERPFEFGQISTTSCDELASTSELATKALGSIELRYRRIKKIKPRDSGVKGEFEELEIPTFHEDSKVAMLGHQGRLGPSQIAQFKEERQNKYVYHESKENPFHTFTFLYRSRDFLQSRNLLNPISSLSTSRTTPPAAIASSSSSIPSNSIRSALREATRANSISSSSVGSSRRSTSRGHQRRQSGTAETELYPLYMTGEQPSREVEIDSDPRRRDLTTLTTAETIEEELQKLERELESLKEIEKSMREKDTRTKRDNESLETEKDTELTSRGRKKARVSVNEGREIEVIVID